MYNLILSLYLLVTICLVIVILFQKSAGIAMNARQTLGGPRARGNPLTKFTGILGFSFMFLCLMLTRLNISKDKTNKLIQISETKPENIQEDKVMSKKAIEAAKTDSEIIAPTQVTSSEITTAIEAEKTDSEIIAPTQVTSSEITTEKGEQI